MCISFTVIYTFKNICNYSKDKSYYIGFKTPCNSKYRYGEILSKKMLLDF